MRKPAWARSPRIWEQAKSNVRKQYGIHAGPRFEELTQAEYLSIGGEIERTRLGVKSLDDLIEENPTPGSSLLMKSEPDVALKVFPKETLKAGDTWVTITRVEPNDPSHKFMYGVVKDEAPRMELTKSGEDHYYQVEIRKAIVKDGKVGFVLAECVELFEGMYKAFREKMDSEGFEPVEVVA